MLDTLSATKKLESAGFARGQAEALAEVLAEDVTADLATKADIETLRTSTKSELAAVRAEIEAEARAARRGGCSKPAGIAFMPSHRPMAGGHYAAVGRSLRRDKSTRHARKRDARSRRWRRSRRRVRASSGSSRHAS